MTVSLESEADLSPELTELAVSDSEEVRNTIADVVRDFGRIDVFVANAGEHRNSDCKSKRYKLIGNRNGSFKTDFGAEARRVS